MNLAILVILVLCLSLIASTFLEMIKYMKNERKKLVCKIVGWGSLFFALVFLVWFFCAGIAYVPNAEGKSLGLYGWKKTVNLVTD